MTYYEMMDWADALHWVARPMRPSDKRFFLLSWAADLIQDFVRGVTDCDTRPGTMTEDA